MRLLSFIWVLGAIFAASCSPEETAIPTSANSADAARNIALSAIEADPAFRNGEQWAQAFPSWGANIEPFQIIDNVYYVGTEGLSSFLITTPEGHILLDGGLPQNAKLIAQNIVDLGFALADVKILLNSHAHFDHSGGLSSLKEMTGARLIASEGDRSALEGGFYLGAEDKDEYAAPPVAVDALIKDGETVTLGGEVLTAHITPGHTRGCTSWTMTAVQDDTPREVLFFCSATVAGNSLIPPQYEGIVEDYRLTFKKTRDWNPDIFLANHSAFFAMAEKREAQLSGDRHAFFDRAGFRTMMDKLENDFEASLAKASE